MNKSTPLAILLCAVLGACATNSTMYHWGNYEKLIYDMYMKPGKATPELQIQIITEDIQKADAAGKKTPPGVYAHLGTMYAAAGNLSAALESFSEEKSRYPESALLIDGMINRATKGNM